MKIDMTEGKIAQNITRFSVPVLITSICSIMFGMVDAMMLGQFVDAKALGSVSSCSSVINLFMFLSSGFAVGYRVIIGQLFGAGRRHHAKEAFLTALFFMGGLSLLITSMGTAFSRPMLRLLGTVPELLEGADLYIKVYFLGIALIIFRDGINNIFYALGETRVPMYMQIADTMLHILLNFVLLKYFQAGIIGVALAGIISRGVTLIPLVIKIIKTFAAFPKAHLYFSRPSAKNFVKIGVPSCLGNALGNIQVLLMTRLINSCGTAVVTGNSISGQINNLAFLFTNTVASAAGSFAAQNYGAGHIRRIKNCCYICIAINVAYSGVMLVLIKLLGAQMVNVFLGGNTEPQLAEAIRDFSLRYLNVIAYCYVIYGVGHVCSEMLRSVGKVNLQIFSMIMGMITRLSLAYGLIGVMGDRVIYWSIPANWMVYYFIQSAYFICMRWMPHFRGVRNSKAALAPAHKGIKETLTDINR